MNKLLHFIALLMLISSASVQSTTIESNGRQTKNFTCSEFNSSYEKCKSKANELFKNESRILDYHKEVYAENVDGFYMPSKHHFLVECL